MVQKLVRKIGPKNFISLILILYMFSLYLFSVHYTHFRDSCHSYSNNWHSSSENPSSYLISPFKSCWCDNKEKQKNHADFAHYRFDVWCSLVALSYLHDRWVFFIYLYLLKSWQNNKCHTFVEKMVVQSNLALRNFLVTTKKFLKVKSSLFQIFNQSCI